MNKKYRDRTDVILHKLNHIEARLRVIMDRFEIDMKNFEMEGIDRNGRKVMYQYYFKTKEEQVPRD